MKTRYIIIAVIVVALLTTPFWGASAWIYVNSKLYGGNSIRQKAIEITANETDTLRMLNKIADWVSNSVTYDANLSYWYPMYPFYLIRPLPPDPAWVITISLERIR